MRGWTSRNFCGRSRSRPVSVRTRVSISATVASALRAWPCVTSQRGLSGTWRRISRIPSPRTPPIAKLRRQPVSGPSRVRVEQEQRGTRAGGGAEPETPIHDQVDAAAIARRDELIDRRVDGRIFAADAEPGDGTKGGKAQRIPRGCRSEHAGEIDGKGDIEDELASVPIGEPPEHQRADDRARDVGGSRAANLRRGQAKRLCILEDWTDGADDRDFETIEDPGDTERQHDQEMKAAPGKSIEPGGNVGFERASCSASTCETDGVDVDADGV